MANRPTPLDAPRSLGESLSVATQQQPVAAQPPNENSYGPEVTRRLPERPRPSITAATSAAVSKLCARRSRSTELPDAGGVMFNIATPRDRSDYSSTPPQLQQLMPGTPLERPHVSLNPQTALPERACDYNNTSSLIAGMSLDGNWSAGFVTFFAYLSLILYLIGLVQWMIIQLPKNGRYAGKF